MISLLGGATGADELSFLQADNNTSSREKAAEIVFMDGMAKILMVGGDCLLVDISVS